MFLLITKTSTFTRSMILSSRAMQFDKMLEASILMQKLLDNIKTLETQSSPVEELNQILKRADNFLHFVLQNAPVVIGHQVTYPFVELNGKKRFMYPALKDWLLDVIGSSCAGKMV